MKKLISLGLIIVMALLVLTGCKEGTTKDGYADTLYLYNWTEYMPQTVLDAFEDEYGIKVKVAEYSSNEELLSKLLLGATSQYDVCVATNYVIESFVEQNLIQPIDLNNITNFKNLDEKYLNLSFDEGNKYSIPYMVSWTAIAVNTDLYSGEISTFDDLLADDLKDSLVVVDDVRELVGIALSAKGLDPNTTSYDDIASTKDWLVSLKNNVRKFDSDSPKTALIDGSAKAGYVWAAEVALAQEENENIKAVFPEGSLYCMDNFVITSEAPHKREAELFIDFCLRPEVVAMIVEDYPYATPNKAALDVLPESYVNNVVCNPTEEIVSKAILYDNVGEAVTYYDEIWNAIKD